MSRSKTQRPKTRALESSRRCLVSSYSSKLYSQPVLGRLVSMPGERDERNAMSVFFTVLNFYKINRLQSNLPIFPADDTSVAAVRQFSM